MLLFSAWTPFSQRHGGRAPLAPFGRGAAGFDSPTRHFVVSAPPCRTVAGWGPYGWAVPRCAAVRGRAPVAARVRKQTATQGASGFVSSAGRVLVSSACFGVGSILRVGLSVWSVPGRSAAALQVNRLSAHTSAPRAQEKLAATQGVSRCERVQASRVDQSAIPSTQSAAGRSGSGAAQSSASAPSRSTAVSRCRPKCNHLSL